MREGLTRTNPIEKALYKRFYPKTPLPDKSYVLDGDKLFFNKKSKLNFLATIKGPGLTGGGKSSVKSKTKSKTPGTRAQMRKIWEERWVLEIKAQKKLVRA